MKNNLTTGKTACVYGNILGYGNQGFVSMFKSYRIKKTEV